MSRLLMEDTAEFRRELRPDRDLGDAVQDDPAGRLGTRMGQAADGRRAESEQSRAVVDGVALEVAPQPAGPLGHRQPVAGLGGAQDTGSQDWTEQGPGGRLGQ